MRHAALLLLAALALAGCGGDDEAGGPAPAPEASGDVQELENVLQLRSDFEADAGATRVVILFSPT